MDVSRILIAAITPYFLDKEPFWFEENTKQILEARKNQSFFQDNTIYAENGLEISLSAFLRKLDEMGYEKVQMVSEPGEFAGQGSIIDIFPINLKYAVRLDFRGNKIESVERLPVEIDGDKPIKEILKKRLKSQKLFSDLRGIKPGDYLVHLDHGVGRFAGFETSVFERSPTPLKYYALEYAAGDKLYIPVGLERKLSKYVGFVDPKISRLGSPLWLKTKRKIREETEKLAKELLEIYATREMAGRPPYAADEEIEKELTGTFQYHETPDQLQVIDEIEKDMEKPEPMDRIVCGDVGFGKTEVAMRAMIRAVAAGRQTALICPTTILANQHYQNFKERLKNLPIKVALLSRLQTKNGQKEIIENLEIGKLDIVVGTHRLLSKDIGFQNLGLLVIDDEQRFGVEQKEKLKKARASLDILSLSATPIPRTLYMALSSLKKISLIQTPPEGRLGIKTFVSLFKEKTIKDAIGNELKRKGQIYYLHNRVETIEMVKKFLEKLTPAAKFGVAHGRMNERGLLRVMDDFQNKKIDILIATTIIENGLDLANVNTLIVADATKLGLAQAYQLRGRVGRSNIQSFAYFLYPKRLSGATRQRLTALKEAEELGSGYHIALKDLEIRGAGNILGKEQSGNANRVGLNLYCQMLSDAIERIKGAGYGTGPFDVLKNHRTSC